MEAEPVTCSLPYPQKWFTQFFHILGVADCEVKLARVKEVKKSYGLELRLLKDKDLRPKYEQSLKQLETRFNDAVNSYQETKSAANKQELIKQSSKKTTVVDKTNDELLLGAAKIQEKTMASLNRTKGLMS